MDENNKAILIKMNYIEDLLTRVENHETPSILTIIKNELDSLKKLAEQIKLRVEEKKVIGKEDKLGRTRYFLKDGSVYVVKNRNYRYLYDAKSKVVTYEFDNGQIERTFENGVKEIRRNDGSVIIKTGQKDYEFM